MDIVLFVLGFILLLTGLAGALLPIPGPPFSLLGIFLIHWSSKVQYSTTLLISLSVLTVLLVVIDYMLPVWGIKKFGGSRAGMWGSTLGLIIGMAGGLLGLLIGAFAGGLIGEFISGKDSASALKAATGSFVGFLLGVWLKLVLCGVMLWYGIKGVAGIG
jgi:uncharacterized protein YqgC (DUF456 family)